MKKLLLILLFTVSFSPFVLAIASQTSVITIDQDGNYYINQMHSPGIEEIEDLESVSLNIAINRVIARKDIFPEMQIIIEADEDVAFGKVMKVIAKLKNYGINIDNKFSFRTESPKTVYINNIAAKVRTIWGYQSGVGTPWGCDVYVIQDREGNVKAVDVQKCNLDDSEKARTFKNSIERAVYKASPLPLPSDESFFDEEIILNFRAN